MRRDDSLSRKGHDQQHDRDTRMRRPGEPGREQNVDQRVCCDRAQQHAQAWCVLIRRDHRQQMVKSDQHQAESDASPAEIAGARDAAAPEHHHADQDEKERDPRDVKRKRLHDQRGADIRAEHHGKRRHQVDEAAGRESGHHRPRGGAALEDGSHAKAGEKRFHAIGESVT